MPPKRPETSKEWTQPFERRHSDAEYRRISEAVTSYVRRKFPGLTDVSDIVQEATINASRQTDRPTISLKRAKTIAHRKAVRATRGQSAIGREWFADVGFDDSSDDDGDSAERLIVDPGHDRRWSEGGRSEPESWQRRDWPLWLKARYEADDDPIVRAACFRVARHSDAHTSSDEERVRLLHTECRRVEIDTLRQEKSLARSEERRLNMARRYLADKRRELSDFSQWEIDRQFADASLIGNVVGWATERVTRLLREMGIAEQRGRDVGTLFLNLRLNLPEVADEIARRLNPNWDDEATFEWYRRKGFAHTASDLYTPVWIDAAEVARHMGEPVRVAIGWLRRHGAAIDRGKSIVTIEPVFRLALGFDSHSETPARVERFFSSRSRAGKRRLAIQQRETADRPRARRSPADPLFVRRG